MQQAKIKALGLDQAQAKNYKFNPRKITQEQEINLAEWMQELGDISGIVWERNTNQFVSGNQRSERLNFAQARIEWKVVMDQADHQGTLAVGYVYMKTAGGDIPFNLRLVDWPDPDKIARASIIANKAGGTWDQEMLLRDFGQEMLLNIGWTEKEIKEGSQEEQLVNQRTPEPTIPAKPKQPLLEPGDLVELTSLATGTTHRIKVGMATEADDARHAQGTSSPNLLVTYMPTTITQNALQAIELFTGNVAYIWHDVTKSKAIKHHMQEAGFDIVSQIVWHIPKVRKKPGTYSPGHLVCWYAVRKGKTQAWQGRRDQSTVWDAEGTFKHRPLLLHARPMRNNTKITEAIYDPFLGTGNGIIAAQFMNRECIGIEEDPAKADMAVTRYTNWMTNQETPHVVMINGEQVAWKQPPKASNKV